MTDEKLVTAAERLRTVAADLKAAASALLEQLDAVEACGVSLNSLDRQHIKVRFLDALPYTLEKKAGALVPKLEAVR